MTQSHNMTSSITVSTDLNVVRAEIERLVKTHRCSGDPPSSYSQCSTIRFGLTYLAVALKSKGINSFDSFVFYARDLYRALNIEPSKKLRLVIRKTLAGTKHPTILVKDDGTFDVTETGVRLLYSCALLYGSCYKHVVEAVNRIAEYAGNASARKRLWAGELFVALDENMSIVEIGSSMEEIMRKLRTIGADMKRISIHKLTPIES